MTSQAKDDHVLYASLPSDPSFVQPQPIVVLPLYRPPRRTRSHLFLFFIPFSAILLFAAVFFLYPSDPNIRIDRVHLNHVRIHSSPKLVLDLSFSLLLRVKNQDFFSLDYDSLGVSVGYRGRELGFVSSKGGRVRARRSSYVNATLDLDGFEVIHDVFYLLEDLARGVIPFDTSTMVEGNLGILFLKIPLKMIEILKMKYSERVRRRAGKKMHPCKSIVRDICKYKQPDYCSSRLLPRVMLRKIISLHQNIFLSSWMPIIRIQWLAVFLWSSL